MRNRLAAAAVAGSLAAAVAAPFALAAPSRPSGNVVQIAALASGLQYSTKTLHAAAGKVTIVFTNRSQLQHNVRLEIGEYV
jgi:plastocyanin